MHILRPFTPMEVLNTRICSRVDPAPGNRGFDGCLEFLRLQCRRRCRAATVWDVGAFHWIAADGTHLPLPKADLLAWPLPRLAFTLPALRLWTQASGGQVPTRDLLRALDWLIDCGACAHKTLECHLTSTGTAAASTTKNTTTITGSRIRARVSSTGLRRRESVVVLLPRIVTVRVLAFAIGGDIQAWRKAHTHMGPANSKH